ncbi:hypothetical protein KP509_06G055700 [Ceratopteris richardii]|uniref:Uncharacterized protein n=1 Tax=Ceratopteris richardii TaxID=49495 RepID=A0A8T2UIF1_CERRI|nr:hypothetical protein KP509_06G055700 [Ceratopteris richardii]
MYIKKLRTPKHCQTVDQGLQGKCMQFENSQVLPKYVYQEVLITGKCMQFENSQVLPKYVYQEVEDSKTLPNCRSRTPRCCQLDLHHLYCKSSNRVLQHTLLSPRALG